jgi:hypothetical protein
MWMGRFSRRFNRKQSALVTQVIELTSDQTQVRGLFDEEGHPIPATVHDILHELGCCGEAVQLTQEVIAEIETTSSLSRSYFHEALELAEAWYVPSRDSLFFMGTDD